MKTRQYLKTGCFHRLNEQECQDSIFVREADGFLLAAAADGATACRLAGTGAKLACRGAADFFDREREQVFDYPAEKLCYLLVEHILYFLERETGSRSDTLPDYASTLAAAFTETATGRTLAVNLGDGCIMLHSHGQCRMLLPPKRYHGCPCLTTTQDAYQAMAVRQTSLYPSEALLLCTDGFLHFLRASPDGNTLLLSALRSGGTEPLDRAIDAFEEPDDCCYLAVWKT